MRVSVAAALVGTSLATWLVLAVRLRGMDTGPGTDLGGLGWFLGMWVTMTAAMMLPSIAPTVMLFATVSRRFVATVVFIGGYLAAWTAYGLVAYGAFRAVHALAGGALAWDRAGRFVAAAALAAAGIYELTPLKRACLRRCRAPLRIVVGAGRAGPARALRLGCEHGAVCVACCLGLMLALFALGAMSLAWMGLAAAAIFVQRATPLGERAAVPLAAGLLALGIGVAA